MFIQTAFGNFLYAKVLLFIIFDVVTGCNVSQRVATHCNALQHVATVTKVTEPQIIVVINMIDLVVMMLLIDQCLTIDIYELDAEDGNDDTKMNYQKVMKKRIVSKMQKHMIEEVMMVVLQLLFLQVTTITIFLFRINLKEHLTNFTMTFTIQRDVRIASFKMEISLIVIECHCKT